MAALLCLRDGLATALACAFSHVVLVVRSGGPRQGQAERRSSKGGHHDPTAGQGVMAEWSPQAVERGELSEAKLHLAPNHNSAVPSMALV